MDNIVYISINQYYNSIKKTTIAKARVRMINVTKKLTLLKSYQMILLQVYFFLQHIKIIYIYDHYFILQSFTETVFS